MWTNYFDRIFLLNLKSRADRLEDSITELEKYKIPFEWYEATPDNNGEEGVYKSLTRIFREALANGWDRVLVFEDDVEIVHEDFNEIMDKCVKQLPEDWEQFLLGCNLLCPSTGFQNKNLIKVQMSYALHAAAYSKSFMVQFLSLPKSLPVDRMIALTIMRNNKTYASYPMLCNQRLSKSSINDYSPDMPGLRPYWDEEVGTVNWGKFMKEQYEKHTAHLKINQN